MRCSSPGLLEILRSGEISPRPRPEKRRWKGALLITEASPGHAEFATDRGRRTLSAWCLGGPEIDGAFWVLDPAVVSSRWAPSEPGPPRPFDGLPHRAAAATIDSDGVTLHFTFTGAPPEYAQYPAAEVIESDQAIAVLPVARDVGPPGPRFTIGRAREVIVTLAQPPGQRVLVDLDASPVMIPAHDPT